MQKGLLLAVIIILLVALAYYARAGPPREPFWTAYVTDQTPNRRFHAADVPVKPWAVVSNTPACGGNCSALQTCATCSGQFSGTRSTVAGLGPVLYAGRPSGALGSAGRLRGPFSIADEYGDGGSDYTQILPRGAGFTDLPLNGRL